MKMVIQTGGPHQGGAVHVRGDLQAAQAGAVFLHGRGATAESILSLADTMGLDSIAYLAPQAAGRTWYPHRFLEPVERNEPWLSGALAVVAEMVEALGASGIPPERVALLGFSQGACLALESAIRQPQRYGAVVGLSGGLIGPPGTSWPSPTALAATPVFLGCGDQDDHIPVDRVRESAEVFERAGANVAAVIYRGMPHTVNENEVTRVRALFAHMAAANGSG